MNQQDRTVCLDCGQELQPPFEDQESNRVPCPNCGSVRRSYSVSVADMAGASDMVADLSVLRGINETRLALLALLVGIALTVGFGIDADWWVRLLAALASFAVTAFLVANTTTRHWLMSFMHRILEGKDSGG